MVPRPPAAAAMRAYLPAFPAEDRDGLRVPGNRVLRVRRQARLAEPPQAEGPMPEPLPRGALAQVLVQPMVPVREP